MYSDDQLMEMREKFLQENRSRGVRTIAASRGVGVASGRARRRLCEPCRKLHQAGRVGEPGVAVGDPSRAA